jgi:hypothetical protein
MGKKPDFSKTVCISIDRETYENLQHIARNYERVSSACRRVVNFYVRCQGEKLARKKRLYGEAGVGMEGS